MMLTHIRLGVIALGLGGLTACSRGDRFGNAVAVSADGNTLAVGSPQEDGGAAGIDRDQSDDSASASGAADLY